MVIQATWMPPEITSAPCISSRAGVMTGSPAITSKDIAAANKTRVISAAVEARSHQVERSDRSVIQSSATPSTAMSRRTTS